MLSLYALQEICVVFVFISIDQLHLRKVKPKEREAVSPNDRTQFDDPAAAEQH